MSPNFMGGTGVKKPNTTLICKQMRKKRTQHFYLASRFFICEDSMHKRVGKAHN